MFAAPFAVDPFASDQPVVRVGRSLWYGL